MKSLFFARNLPVVAGAVLLSGASAFAQDANALYTRALAATCANCHGTNGRAIENSEVPGLVGMPAAYLVAQMQAFRKGERPATVMHQLAKGYTDEQIQQIAAYFAAQKK